MEIYHLTAGAIGWGPDERRQAGDVLINPPDRIVERYEHKLDRLDDGTGKIPREIIDELPEYHLRRIARMSNEPIDENTDINEIISVLESTDHDIEDVERQAAEVVENIDRDGPLEQQETQPGAETQTQDQDQEQEQTLLRGDEQNAVDPEVEEQSEQILDEIDRRERLTTEDESQQQEHEDNA